MCPKLASVFSVFFTGSNAQTQKHLLIASALSLPILRFQRAIMDYS